MIHKIISELSLIKNRCLVVLVAEDKKLNGLYEKNFAKSDLDYLKKVLENFDASWLTSEYIILPHSFQPLLVVGIGDNKKITSKKIELLARKIIKNTKKIRQLKLVINLLDFRFSCASNEDITKLLVTNFEIGNYEFNYYKEIPKKGFSAIEEILYYSTESKMIDIIDQGKIIGQSVNAARDLSNTPGGDMTPELLAKKTKELIKDLPIELEVLDEAEMKKLGMGGILGVSRGSEEPAKFIIMKYLNSKSTSKPIVFVGKGITFDSGGLHVKPSNSMNDMHLDMAGGAAVIGAMIAIAKLKPQKNIIGVVPAAENMPSGQSYRPGDILKMMSGKTVEVLTPDAEGRIILADAFTYVQRFKPELVVDVATLTGAASVALGHHAIALLTPDDKLQDKMYKFGQESGDYSWPLPMWEEYEADVKAPFADVLNASKSREAGTINGGMFLYQFAKEFKAWAHFDIASTMTSEADQLLAKGATGSGVRILVQIALKY